MDHQEATERNIESIARAEATSLAERSAMDCIVDSINDFCGSMTFVWIHAALFTVWAIWNTLPLIPKAWHFDPFPFQFLTLFVSLEAIFLSTFLLISQNRQGRVATKRNHLDLQINMRAEQQNTKMLALLMAIAAKLDIESDDPEVLDLEREIAPEEILGKIERMMNAKPPRPPRPEGTPKIARIRRKIRLPIERL